MSAELPQSRERRGTLIESLDNARLVGLADKTVKIRVIDRLYERMLELYDADPSLENLMVLEHLVYRREVVTEINLLEVDFRAADDDEIALEEEINEALFKPFGEQSE